MLIVKQLDQHLLDLCWSLWTELGVAGVIRNHQNTLILLEELLLFTSVICEQDPRLRDEVIDWCVKFHRFISISRLKSLTDDFAELIKEPFSRLSATVNQIAKTNWPILTPAQPSHVILSQKSVLRPHASSALLNIRARGIFGSGSRADLITFFLVHSDTDLSIYETTQIGYSKRNLAEILEDLHFSGLFTRFSQGNQYRYRLNKDSPLLLALQPIPEYTQPWRLVLTILLILRACLIKTENMADTTKVIEIVNCLAQLEAPLQKLGLTPPPFSNDFSQYIQSFNRWLLEWSSRLAKGK